jgi:membrane fusion protein (multidrug efflux system)
MCIVLFIVFGGLIGFNIFKQIAIKYFFAHYQPPAVTVSSVIVQKRDLHPHLSAVGTFVAINGVDINTQSGGKVYAIHFQSGEFVQQNAPLIDIDDSVEQATLKFNQADLALQQTNYQRQSDLFKRNAAAKSSLDDSKARLLQAEANVEKIQAEISLKHIKAPFAGIVGIRLINLGQFVQPGNTSIVTLQSLDPIYLNFYIPEQYIDTINVGQSIHFKVEQNPGVVYQGTISAINSKIDENTHNVQIQATIANCPAVNPQTLKQTDLFKEKQKADAGEIGLVCDTSVNVIHKINQFNFIPGMFASIQIELPIIHNRVMVPTTAISYTMYGNSVFVIDSLKNEQEQERYTVRRVFVSTGDSDGDYTLVTKGLKAGQMIVSIGELKLQNGTQVVIDNHNPLPHHDNIEALGE